MPLDRDPSISWKELVVAALLEAGGEAHLSQLNHLIEGHPKTAFNPTWRDTIRRVVRQYSTFEPVPPDRSGVYRYVGEPVLQPPLEVTISAEPTQENHGTMQGALAQLGRLYGYDTFIPAADRSSRLFEGTTLQHFSTLTSLGGVTLDATTRRRLEQIDVVWTIEDTDGTPWPRYAFEVEHSTGVRSGLERMRNLPSRFDALMYIVAPGDSERSRFQTYVQESGYRQMSNRLTFVQYSEVREMYNLASRHDRLRLDLGFKYGTRLLAEATMEQD